MLLKLNINIDQPLKMKKEKSVDYMFADSGQKKKTLQVIHTVGFN